MFNSKKLKPNDVIKSILLGAAIILFWRGIWELADVYLYPNNIIISAIASILLGLAIIYIYHFDFKALRP